MKCDNILELIQQGKSVKVEFKASFDRNSIESLIADIQTDHYPSQLRNKLVAEAFYLPRNIEKYGSGFIRIREALRDYPELAFSVQEIGNGVLVSFIRHADTTPASIDKPEGVSEGVNEGVTRLYQYIAQHPGQRLPELSKQLQVPAKTLERWLKQLKQTHLIHFQGAPKTGGYYQQNTPWTIGRG